MKKEILTKERISKEIKKAYSWKGAILVSVALSVLISFLIFVISLLYKEFEFEHGAPLILYVLCLVVLGGGTAILIMLIYITTYRSRRSADQRNYQVILDQLVHAEDNRDRILSGDGAGVYRYLVFASFGTYEIPKKTHYFWSDLYAMSDEGVYNTAVEGDTFYIVTDTNKTILAVYNTKFFEYKDE